MTFILSLWGAALLTIFTPSHPKQFHHQRTEVVARQDSWQRAYTTPRRYHR